MTAFNVSHWLQDQVGRNRADVLSAAKLAAVETKNAVKQLQKGGRAQRGNVSLQMRAAVSAASKADSRMRQFLIFAQQLNKRPAGINLSDWAVYHDITVFWVENGCIQPDTLKLFGPR